MKHLPTLRAPARPIAAVAAAVLAAGLAACTSTGTISTPTAVRAPASADPALRAKVQNIVVIYAENRSFDNLFGRFPGADGLGTVLDGNGKPTAAYVTQKDRDGRTVLATLPQTWNGVTAPGQSPAVTQAQSAGLPNRPFAVETAFQPSAGATLSMNTVTRDLVHRFFENQMQIDGGRNDMFAAWADAGGLTMGHFDNSGSAIYKLAQQYVLADHFFQGAFGGSFLNHQYLICACAPEYPNADTAPAKPSITVLDKDAAGHSLPRLATAPNSPASAMDGPPRFVLSGNLTPADYFGDGKFHAVNTMQPAYQPSGNAPADAGTAPFASTAKPTTLPPQTQATIGDLLSAKGVDWRWYAGAWNAALADGMQPAGKTRSVIYASNANGVATPASVGFQPHHHPFNYYAAFDPAVHAADRAAHLKDYTDLVADAAAGTLPPVAFYKPEGVFNQHEGYANLADGDARIADVVARLQAGPQWKHMVVVITYDEFGGVWDHVAPPMGDKLGPGTRIPAIVVSPLAKAGTVDHTPYDTASVLRLVIRRFALGTLPGLAARDAALQANGAQAMGDLTNALNLD
jgi:acid phosphatase